MQFDTRSELEKNVGEFKNFLLTIRPCSGIMFKLSGRAAGKRKETQRILEKSEKSS